MFTSKSSGVVQFMANDVMTATRPRRSHHWGMLRLVLVATLLLCACKRESPSPTTQPRAPASGPKVYVTNEDSGDVTIIDSATNEVTGRIAVGKRPRGVRVHNHQLFVALSGTPKGGPGVNELQLVSDRAADGIAVVDLRDRKLARVLPSGHDPESFDVAGGTLVVSNEDSALASFVDLARGEVVGSVKVGGEPEGVTTHPSGKFVYVTSETDSRVDVLEVSSRSVVATIETGHRPRAIAFTPDGTRAFVTCEMSGSVTVIDAIAHKKTNDVALASDGVEPRPRPMGARVSPDGRTLWVSAGRAKYVYAIDAQSLALKHTIPDVGVRPWGLDITGDGRFVYVANGPSNDVTVIDASTAKIVKRIVAGSSPWGVAVAR